MSVYAGPAHPLVATVELVLIDDVVLTATKINGPSGWAEDFWAVAATGVRNVKEIRSRDARGVLLQSIRFTADA